MNGDTPRWTWRSSHRQNSNNKPGLTWASLKVLAPKKDDDNGVNKLRRGSIETSSISTTRPRFAAPVCQGSEPKENEAPITNSNDTGPRRLEPIHSYLMLSTANGAVNSRRLDAHLESSNTPYTIGNLSIHKSSPHSSNYHVECMGEKFTGFHRIFFDDTPSPSNASPSSTTTSFYKKEVSPLAREFVNKQRNICIVVHGASGTGRRRILFGDGNSSSSNALVSNLMRESPYYRRQPDDIDDDVSSLGSQGVSEIQNINTSTEQKVRPKVQIIPHEVSVVSSSTFSQQSSTPEQNCASPSRSDGGGKKNDNNGIIPKLLDDICKKLRKYHPQSSFCCDSGGGDMAGDNIPRVIPPEQSSSKCILGNNPNNNNINNINASKKKLSSPPHRGSIDTCATDNAFISPQGYDSLVGVRVSCFEIVDDLASGKTTTHDLLSECVQTEHWPIYVMEEEDATPPTPNHPPKQKSRRRTYDTSMRSSISWGDGELNNSSNDGEDSLVDFGKSDDDD